MGSRVGDLSSLINSGTSLAPIFLGKGTVTKTGQSLDDDSRNSLKKLLDSGQYGKGAAKSDAQGAIDAIVRQIMESGTSSIAAGQKGTGLYNDTTSQLLANDLKVKAAEKGAELQLANIKDYATIQNQTAQNLKGTKVTETTKTAPTIEDPMMAALKTAGIGIGASVIGNLVNSIFSPDQKKKGSDDDFFGGGSSGSDFFGDVNVAQSSIDPSFSSDLDFSGGNNLPDLGSNIDYKSGNDAISDFGGGAAGGVIGSLASALIGSLGGTSSTNSSGGVSGGWDCFITTAVTRASGLPDDCEQLTALREFRDTYMQLTPERRELVTKYYDLAPRIVNILEAFEPSRRIGIYTDFLQSYIEPALDAIYEGDNQTALEIYTELFNLATELSEE